MSRNDDRDYDDYERNSRGDAKVKTPEELARETEALAKKNEKELVESLKFKVDEKDGKTRLLGIEIPNTLVPFLNIGVDMVVGPLSHSVSNSVFKNTSRLGEYYLKDAVKAHHLATNAEMAARWGIIFAKPISLFVNANMGFARERTSLYKELKPIMEATNVDYYKNEVVRGAFRKLHDEWFQDIMLIAPDSLALAPQVISGLEKQKQVREQRLGQLDGIEALNKSINDLVAEQTKKIKSGLDMQLQTDKIYAEQRKQFINKPPKEILYHDDGETRRDAKALGLYFDKNIGDQVRKDIKQMQYNAEKAKQPAKNEKQDENYLNNWILWTTALSGASQAMKTSMKEENQKKKSATAYELIQHLKEELTANLERKEPRAAEQIIISPIDRGNHKKSARYENDAERDLSLKDYVVSIFQELEDDMSRTKFAGGLLERLETAIDPIVENLATGRLDAMALVKLVGENKVVVHGANGKRSFRTEKEIVAAVEELLGGQLDKADGINAEEFFANFANAVLAKETVAANLKTMTDEQRGFFASIMPIEVLMQAGFKMPAIVQMRKEGHKAIYDVVAESTLELTQYDDEQLTKLGLSKEAVAALKEMKEQIISGDEEALKIAVDGKDHTLVNAIAVATLSEQLGGKKESWADRVVKAATVHDRINEIRAELQASPKALPMDADLEEHHPHHKTKKHAHQHRDEEMGEHEINEHSPRLHSKAEHELSRREKAAARENHLGQGA